MSSDRRPGLAEEDHGTAPSSVDSLPVRIRSSLPYLLKGTLVPDMIAVMGSMFFIVGDIDR